MQLLIDIGNTRIKWAAADAGAALGKWRASGAGMHDALPVLAAEWRSLDVDRVVVANVAGAAMQDRLAQSLSMPVEWFASSAAASGLRNAYRDPATLGCDRFAAAIGARAVHPGRALIVVNCGTATTVDAVSPDGIFAGGMILPGLQLMAASLAKNTARLPQIDEKQNPVSLFADNTADAIAAGCLNAQAGAIERACAEWSARHGDALCVVSGGAAGAVAPRLAVTHAQMENLVLIGLQAYAATL